MEGWTSRLIYNMMWTYFVLYSVKWKYWNDLCRNIEILAYKVTKFEKWEGWMCPLV